MSYYEYRVVPAPRALAQVKGAKDPEDRYGRTLELALNAEGREGWEFQRIETVSLAVKRGLLSRSRVEQMTVMVFRRWVEFTAAGGEGDRGGARHARDGRSGSLRHETEPPLRSFQGATGD